MLLSIAFGAPMTEKNTLRSLLAITLGDPLGIGVEITHKALKEFAPWQHCATVLIGSLVCWNRDCKALGFSDLKAKSIQSWDDVKSPGLYFFDIGYTSEPATELKRGEIACASLAQLKGVPSGYRLAVVTAPIDKHPCHLSGFAFPGQTEFIADLWGGEAIMVLAGPKLRVGLVTNHLSLKDVARSLSVDLVARKIELFYQTLSSVLGIKYPKIGVTGVNPHAGDQGLFGREEIEIIAPAIMKAKNKLNTDITGPMPADTAFYQGYHGKLDGILSMYHDQGLGPLKTVHFDEAINISGGLKHLRVSPDHGPAADLYLKGQASAKSMELAVDRALYYLQQR